MTNEITKTEEKSVVSVGSNRGNRSLTFNNIDEIFRAAKAFSISQFIPRCYQGKPNDIMCALTLGMELGLPPLKSLQSIAVVNGVPCIYGDAQLALVFGSGLLALHKETFEGVEFNDEYAAVCEVKRKGEEESTIQKFTVKDARTAGLWGKVGPWKTHPKRMLKYKVRAFSLRDKFPDVLSGVTHSIEEMEGENMKDVTPKRDQERESIVDQSSELFS
jgi:hypothetical protein